MCAPLSTAGRHGTNEEIMKFLFGILLATGLLFAGVSPAEACGGRGCSYYNWDNYGNCNEYTPSGNFIRAAAPDLCRRVARSYTNWDNYGNCNEYTPNGDFIRALAADNCRRARGSYYNWDNYGNCNEYSPNGNFIRAVGADACRRECGVVRRR